MGGRGANFGGGSSGGNILPLDTTSLISEREGKRAEVDDTLKVLKDVEDRYGVRLSDVQVVTLAKKDSGVMAYYDAFGNLAVNDKYFDGTKMNGAYDACVKNGFHPSRGNKSGLEAVVAHEMGHRLNHKAGGENWDNLDKEARNMVQRASKSLGYKSMKDFTSKISGYAKKSYAEAVAEAFADVYCNGDGARKESRALVGELNKYF